MAGRKVCCLLLKTPPSSTIWTVTLIRKMMLTKMTLTKIVMVVFPMKVGFCYGCLSLGTEKMLALKKMEKM